MDPVELLRGLLPTGLGPRLDALWREFEAIEPDPNPHGFVTWLHNQGHLPGADARRILTSGHVLLTLSGDPDAPALRGQGQAHEPLGLIGRGAMGEVLVVRDKALRRTVALKRTLAGAAGDRQRLEFLNEAQITAQLDHSGIVPVYAFEGGAEGALSYSMKLVHGVSLAGFLDQTRQLIERHGAPDDAHSLDERLRIFLDVCDAISYAHEHGVVHRDLKPDNIMVARFGEVLVMDWGIAAPIPAERGSQGLRVIGTPAYLSPEQAMGAPFALEPPSDQYSLGLVLYELICLRLANPGETPLTAIGSAQGGVIRDIEPWPGQPPIPRELRAIIGRATARKPGRRYPSVAALADDVRRYARDEQVLTQPDRGLQRLQRWVSHHRQTAVTIGIALALLVVLVSVGLSAMGRARLAAQERAAADREEALAALATRTTRQVQRLDGELHRFEALLAGVVFAAEDALTGPAPPPPPAVFGLDPPGPDLVLDDAPFYDFPIALDGVDVAIATGVARQDVEQDIARLVSLAPTLRDAALRSVGPHAATDPGPSRERLLSSAGLPLVWTYVATQSGLIVGYPGQAEGYPEDYDPRDMNWYRVSVDEPAPVWNMLEADESGMGLLLTCSQGLHDASGRFLGVGAVDVAFAHLVDELLEAPDLREHTEAFLIDEQGRAVVRSSQKELARTVTEYEPGPFPWANALPDASVDRALGWAEIRGDGEPLLLHWQRLQAVDWMYVVVGPQVPLLELGARL